MRPFAYNICRKTVVCYQIVKNLSVHKFLRNVANSITFCGPTSQANSFTLLFYYFLIIHCDCAKSTTSHKVLPFMEIANLCIFQRKCSATNLTFSNLNIVVASHLLS